MGNWSPPPPARPVYVPPPAQFHAAPAPAATPACDTMFIGSLSPHTAEDDVHAILCDLKGFSRMKFCGHGTHAPTAFALFDSVDSCRKAITRLHGMALSTAPDQALNCEFAKNSLDRRGR